LVDSLLRYNPGAKSISDNKIYESRKLTEVKGIFLSLFWASWELPPFGLAVSVLE
jgi:hypothetical protein